MTRCKAWSPSVLRNHGPRYCDDGWRCPGHPDWKPWEPRRALRKNVSTDGIRIAEGDRKILIVGFLACADASGRRPNLYPDYRRSGR